jgi:regulator of replication initiation timing
MALAVAFLGFSLLQFTLQIPAMLVVIKQTSQTVDTVNPKIDDIVNEISLIRLEVGKVRSLLAKQTPDILSQIDATLPVIEQVITESEYYSRQLPDLLSQVNRIEQQIAVLQTSLPSILKRIDAVVNTTDNTLVEASLWRPHSTKYLHEIELSRAYIPKYLTRIEQTIVDAKTIGQEASSGIVSGFFKGVISLPFEVVAGLKGMVDVNSRSAKHFTAEDITLMQRNLIVLLNDNKLTSDTWINNTTGNGGTIIKGKETKRNRQQCINVTFNNHFKNQKETLRELMCIDSGGVWKVI